MIGCQGFLRTGGGRSDGLGFTLVEVLVLVSIVVVLAVLALPSLEKAFQASAKPRCMANLRNLYIAFSQHLNEGNPWPQVPAGIEIGSVAEGKWWLENSDQTMGLKPANWTCPLVKKVIDSAAQKSGSAKFGPIAYLPTLFDEKLGSPYRWPRLPWFVEALGVHSGGNLTIRADGSVSPARDP